MKWFDNWLAKKVRRSWDEAGESRQFRIGTNDAISINSIVGAKTASLVAQDRMDSSPDLNFRMYRAENGYIMEVRQYDKRTDRHSNNLHLIPDGDDLGQHIAQIITVESLKVN